MLVVDPLTPRGVVRAAENCRPPTKVREPRMRKDAFDAAEHLRKQPFVDPERIGLLGMSMGAMAALGASAEFYATPQGRRAFRAIVSIYPGCFFGNVRVPGRRDPVNLHYIPPTRIVVLDKETPPKDCISLQVQMGELDTETPPKDCISRLQGRGDKDAPIDLVVHKNATHGWDIVEFDRTRRTVTNGQVVVYRYSPKVTAESVRQAFDFLDRHVKRK